jgi:hypothetical protein
MPYPDFLRKLVRRIKERRAHGRGPEAEITNPTPIDINPWPDPQPPEPPKN